jgi:hypothetical protein
LGGLRAKDAEDVEEETTSVFLNPTTGARKRERTTTKKKHRHTSCVGFAVTHKAYNPDKNSPGIVVPQKRCKSKNVWRRQNKVLASCVLRNVVVGRLKGEYNGAEPRSARALEGYPSAEQTVPLVRQEGRTLVRSSRASSHESPTMNERSRNKLLKDSARKEFVQARNEPVRRSSFFFFLLFLRSLVSLL